MVIFAEESCLQFIVDNKIIATILGFYLDYCIGAANPDKLHNRLNEYKL